MHRAFPSPFNPDHLRIVGIDGVSRRWQDHQNDPTQAERLQATARHVLTGCNGRTAIWFPSHQMLDDYVEEGFLHGVERSIHREHPDMTQTDTLALLRRFSNDSDPNAVLLGVLGGRLTEGIDYPGDLLEHVLILGIPYPRPSARLDAQIHYQDLRHDGQGWTHAVHNPVGRVLRQAVGRLIRGPEDRGTAWILDERVARFQAHLVGLRMVPAGNPFQQESAHDGFVAADVIST